MEVTTWVKRRQREGQAVSRKVEAMEPRNNAHWSGRHAHKHGRRNLLGCNGLSQQALPGSESMACPEGG